MQQDTPDVPSGAVPDPTDVTRRTPPQACSGLAGGCLLCIVLYRLAMGADSPVPTCVICGGEHWAYQPHTTDQGGGLVDARAVAGVELPCICPDRGGDGAVHPDDMLSDCPVCGWAYQAIGGAS